MVSIRTAAFAKGILWVVVLIVSPSPLMPTGLLAQKPDTVEIPAAVTCESCRILLDSLVVLGDESGDGFVDSTNEVAASTEHFFVVHRVISNDIRVFDRNGSFKTVLGRAGEGPGEYRNIKALWVSPGDTLHVVDASSVRRTMISPDLQVIRTDRVPGPVQYYGFLGLSDGSSILTAIAPDSLGELRLLHRLSPSGELRYSFGPPLNGSNPFNTPGPALVRIAAETKLGQTLISHGSEFLISMYGDNGALEKALRFPNREFLELVPGGGRFPGYLPWIQDLWVDDDGRLWVLMRVGDPGWEQGVERVGVGFGRRPSVKLTDYDAFWDTVIEVVDLEAGVTLARTRLEKNLIKFLGANRVTGRTYMENGTYRLPVLRLRLDGLATGMRVPEIKDQE